MFELDSTIPKRAIPETTEPPVTDTEAMPVSPTQDSMEPEKHGRFEEVAREIHAHPNYVYARRFFTDGVWKDVKESNHKVRTISLIGAVTVTQTLDRLHLSTIGVPYAATHVLRSTHNPWLTGAAAAAAYAGWQGVAVGETLTQGMEDLPNTVEATEESFPSMVTFFEDALPGFDSSKREDGADQATEKQKKFGRKILSTLGVHWKRALSGIGLGSTAYVATGYVQNHDKSEARKHNLASTGDTGVFLYGVAALAGGSIIFLGDHGFPELANHIENAISDMRPWYALAGLVIGYEWWSSHRAKKKLAKEAAQAVSQQVEVVPVDEEATTEE